MSYDKEINYLKSNKFKKHSHGNSACYGLNFLGSPSIIEYNNQLYIFIYWLPCSNIANYINAKGEIFSFNPYNKQKNITRMEEDNNLINDISHLMDVDTNFINNNSNLMDVDTILINNNTNLINNNTNLINNNTNLMDIEN
jgi:hypothetical protein